MKKKPRKFYINTFEALKVLKEGYGFIPREMNFYQIRLRHEESKAMWDWYHTQGTLVVMRNGKCHRFGKVFGQAEELARFLLEEQVYKAN